MRRPHPGWTLAALSFLVLAAGCENRQLEELQDEAQSKRSSAAAGLESRSLPSLALPAMDGDTVKLGDRLGRRATLVNFWATWCVPCREEMPALVELHRQFGDRGVEIVGIAVASPDTGRIRDWIRRYDVEFPILHDMSGQELLDYTGWDAVPTTVVVDGDGTVRHVMFGARSRHELVSVLTPLLDR